MPSMREAIKPGLESQSSLVVEIFLLFGNKINRLLRTQNELLKGCTFSRYLFSSIHYFQLRSIFLKKSGDFANYARLYFEFLKSEGG